MFLQFVLGRCILEKWMKGLLSFHMQRKIRNGWTIGMDSLCMSDRRTSHHTRRSLMTSRLEDRERGVFIYFFFFYQFDRHLGTDFLSNTGCNLSLNPLEYVSSNQFLTVAGSWALMEFWPLSPSIVARDCWFSWGLTCFDLTRILTFNVSYFSVSGMWHFEGCTSELWCVFMAVGAMKIQ